jgi:hypothetical protein
MKIYTLKSIFKYTLFFIIIIFWGMVQTIVNKKVWKMQNKKSKKKNGFKMSAHPKCGFV